ncbi:hypothetical protein FRB90_001450 [Tulasnella sp. 427]|nr:hypothetical protein FRB90_001450 [Tulasnella sp. 427]
MDPTSDDLETGETVSVTVLGLLGILDLFQCPYLFVITAKTDMGNLYKGSHAVHCIKGVAVIPLGSEALAAEALKLILAKSVTKPTPAPPTVNPPTPMEDVLTPKVETREVKFVDPFSPAASAHIKFTPPQPTAAAAVVTEETTTSSTLTNNTLMLPPGPAFESLASTPPSSVPPSRSITPLSNSLLGKLSFWKRAPSRQTTSDTLETSSLASAKQDESDDEFDSDDVASGGKALDNLLQQAPAPKTPEEKRTQLETRVVREIAREFSRGIFYYTHDFDLTRSLQHKHEMLQAFQDQDERQSDPTWRTVISPETPQRSSRPNKGSHEKESDYSISPLAEPQSNLPLWRRVDRKFWWNEVMAKPFTDAGLHSFVLPVMQGYFQISTFHVADPDERAHSLNEPPTPPKEIAVQYAIISRRSKERAGLRYQRRGIDDDAKVANLVETETVIQVKRQGTWNVLSHVQIRGSIPLFWSQPGINLKPPPVLDRPREESMGPLTEHFVTISQTYGPITAVNVAELAGKEAAVTTPYREAVQAMNETPKPPRVTYTEFDFHRECAGMHYENIAKLVSKLDRTFESQAFFWVSGPVVLCKQKGVFRVNCIDCLDRTNVVMSAFARHVLNSQLEAVALIHHHSDAKSSEMENVVNDLWANNGDAISRAYAGTSALKGDFTRTGRRDFGGMLNDGMNSVMRMYSSTFSDYFSQACIDFFLGNRTTTVFSEFLSKLTSTDPKEIIRLSKIRAAAIETSTEMVLYPGETLIRGWTLLSPYVIGVKVGGNFVEKVLLLSKQALYIVDFDYTMVKVKGYTRVPLGDITSIQKGAYILSALQEASRTVVDNYGFIINFRPRHSASRVTSYALRNQTDTYRTLFDRVGGAIKPASSSSADVRGSIVSNVLDEAAVGSSESLFAAFKALPVEVEREKWADGHDEFVAVQPGQTCKQAVDQIVETIRKACVPIGSANVPDFVIEADVVSLAEAQRLASIYSKFEYGLKRLLWLGVN